jgi:tetratricopeptide (TPR) repeat protein
MSPADLKQFIAERRGRANELVATSEWDAAVVAYSEAIDASWKLLKQLPDGQTAEVLSKQSRQATFLGSINALWANSSLVGSRQPRTSISSTGQLSSELPLPADEKTKDLSILFSNRSAAFLSLRKYPESINDARMAIGLRPGWPKPYFRLGEALSAMTCYDEALAAYSRALEKVCMYIHLWA